MNYKRMLLYSFFIWLIPFLMSFLFFNKEGELLTDRTFFNSIMTLSLTGAFSFFLYLFLKKRDFQPDCGRDILVFGFSAVLVSLILDIITLMGVFHLSMGEFLKWVFPAYFNIIIIAFVIRRITLLQNKKRA